MNDKKELQLDIYVEETCEKCGEKFITTQLTNTKICDKCRR